MERYDALQEPISSEWLALDEDERLVLVRDYHRKVHVKLPNDRVHAAIHVIVENQSALGDELTVRRTLQRLQSEGLDRHEAIHAVGSVLARRIFNVVHQDDVGTEQNSEYAVELDRLTTEAWRRAR